MRPLQVADVQGIHDLYPASEIECIEVFEKLSESLPGLIWNKKSFEKFDEVLIV